MARRRYQFGRVLLRGKKCRKWIGRWREDVIEPDGSTRRIERSAVLGTRDQIPTARLARRCLDLILANINSPDYRPGRVATLAEFSERWCLQALSQRKPSTVLAAQAHLRTHILPRLGRLSLSQVGIETHQVFVAALAQRVARKTLLNILGTLSTMLKTAKKWGYTCQPVPLSELVIPQEKDKATQRFLSAEEAKRIIESAPEPFSTMFAILAMTGIRAGELLGLEVEDLDFERRLIFIRRSAWRGTLQTTKSKASKAALPMPEPLAAILARYLEAWKPNPMRLLFMNRRGRLFNANKVRTLGLQPVLVRLGIPRCGLHAFRHTHSSLLLDVGAPPTVAQAQLRHSDARITLGIYGHVVGDSQRNAVEKVAQLLRPDAPKSGKSGEWIQ